MQSDYRKYGLTFCLIIGAQFFLRNQKILSLQSKVKPDEADFLHHQERTFPPIGKNGTPSHNLPKPFHVKEFSPNVFNLLRHRNNLTREGYFESLQETNQLIRFKVNTKSGSYFFHTQNGLFIVKTIKKEEAQAMQAILPQYVNHVQTNPDTLIAPICGMYYVKAPHLGERYSTYFIVMKSVYASAKAVPIHRLYDLKGSTLGRVAKKEEQIMKDKDFIQREEVIQLGEYRPAFLKQLARDVTFLREMNLMDYSLIIGIHDTTEKGGSPVLDITHGEFSDVSKMSKRQMDTLDPQRLKLFIPSIEGSCSSLSSACFSLSLLICLIVALRIRSEGG